MKVFSFLLFLVVVGVTELWSAPLAGVDDFEGEFMLCLAGEKPEACFAKTMTDKFPPGNRQMNDVVKQLGSLLKGWLADDEIFKVHKVKEDRLGDIHQRRIYLIEDTSGALMMFDASFVNSLGNWYILKFNLTSKQNSINETLGVEF